MNQQVVEPGRRDVVGERLERKPVVSRREAQLGRGQLLGGLDAGQLSWRL
jgi:hypothetical protein